MRGEIRGGGRQGKVRVLKKKVIGKGRMEKGRHGERWVRQRTMKCLN